MGEETGGGNKRGDEGRLYPNDSRLATNVLGKSRWNGMVKKCGCR